MRKTIFFYLFFAFCISLFSIEKSVFIINTTDIHSWLDDEPDIFGRNANFLRLSSAIKQRKKEIGEKDKLLLIDCGDTIQGSYPAALSRGETGIIFLNENEFDAWIPGNHDFDFGFERLLELSKKLNGVSILAANLRMKGCAAWKIFNKNGFKIAVIGATLPYLDFMSLESGKAFIIKDFNIELEKIIPEIMRQSPNAVILAIHHGTFSPKERGGIDLKKVAELYPQINIILGGHSHEDNPGEKFAPSTWFAQAGAHARVFVELEIIFDSDSGRICDIRSKLCDIAAEDAKDTELENRLSKILSDSAKFAATVVGESSIIIPAVPPGVINCEIRELISEAVCEMSGAKTAFSGCGTRLAGFSGKIYEGQLFKLLPYEDTVCVLKLTPEEFKIILQEQIRDFDPRHFQMPWGIFCELDAENRLLALKSPDGQEWLEGRRSVAFSSYAVAGAGGRFRELAKIAKSPGCELIDTKLKIRDAVKEYLKKHSPVSLFVREWIKPKFSPEQLRPSY
jgi:5'-nucleotidase